MMSRVVPSLKLLLAGVGFFLAFALMVFYTGRLDEAALSSKIIVFIGLIPPPVCFGAGLGLAFMHKDAAWTAGVWSNAVAIVAHGALAIVLLNRFLA